MKLKLQTENRLKWRKPRITRIRLDTQQAILQTCKAAGHFFTKVVVSTGYCVSGGGPNWCDYTSRGAVHPTPPAKGRNTVAQFIGS